jgi:hypothetical protein
VSSLIFHTEETQALIATDTLAVLPNGRPLKFTTKAFVLPHLKLVVAGTGIARFLSRWFVRINDEMVVQDIDNLDYHAPRYLASVWPGFKQEFSVQDGLTTTVYHFGFSENTGVIHSFAYRSANNFQSEPIAYGLGVKPECTIPENYSLPNDIRKMMDDQRSRERSQQHGQRLYIGGEIQIHHISKDGCAVYTLDRFEDYSQDEKAIYENFDAEAPE